MRKICVITGTRAEYGLLSRLMQLIKEDNGLELQIIATNMHLSPEFGLTYQEIENDGFVINKKVHMLLSSDTDNATVKSMGLAMIGFADAFTDLKPDLIVILGDRYEMLVAASAALIYKIPIAHIGGGEITEGAYDDFIRHAITKMSHLHFTTTETYRKRVIQMGENPEMVFNVGALGVENVMNTPLMSREELEGNLNFHLGENTFLITFHPVTLEDSTAESQCLALLNALEHFSDYKFLFTYPNSDTDGRTIIKLINEFIEKHAHNSIAFVSLGKVRYLSSLQFVKGVIGNSSSGIIETPSFGIPTLNIGDRQKGRIASSSVINCKPTEDNITKGIEKLISPKIVELSKKKNNPYAKSNTSDEIIKVLKEYSSKELVQKSFYNL